MPISILEEFAMGDWERMILRIGLFVLFVVTFGDYVVRTVWTIIGPWIRHP
jgi:hypothetical protein